jgi:hypothetical protein
MSEEKNKRLCQILGIHWYEYGTKNKQPYAYGCPMCGSTENNPDFYTDAGAVRLLRELEKQEWYLSFMGFAADNLLNEEYFELITTPGLLADKLIEWSKACKR